jgi:hypothetical protein
MSLDDLGVRQQSSVPGVHTNGRGELELIAHGDEKIYDGVVRSARYPTIVGVIGEDHLVIATQRFNSIEVGVRSLAPELRVTTRSGQLVDYVVTVRRAMGIIHPRPVTVCAQTDVKEYDGATYSAVAPEIDGLAVADSAITIQEFDNPKIGKNKTLTPKVWINDGSDGGNYEITLISIHDGEILGSSTGAKPETREILASQLGTDGFVLMAADELTNFTGAVCYVDDKKIYLKLEARKRMLLIVEIERIACDLLEAEVGERLHVVVKGKEVEARAIGQAGSTPGHGRLGR